jgi:pectinesterase
VKNGIYREFVYVPREKRFITLVGEDAEKTVLMYDLYAGLPGLDEKPMGLYRTPTLTVDADDFTVENLTVENFAGTKGPAIALRVDGDRVIFRKCHLLGTQNVVLANRGRQYFQDCTIRGASELVFGGATAFFEHCEIQCDGAGAIVSASTPDTQANGFVFSYCKINGAGEAQVFLGRPLREYAKTVFLNTEMAAVVQPAGWDNWKKPRAEKTVTYAEFNSTGPGGAPAARVPWAKQLTEAEAANYSLQNVVGGADNWNPLRVPEPPARAKKKKAARARVNAPNVPADK